jgi:hypothetical protein
VVNKAVLVICEAPVRKKRVRVDREARKNAGADMREQLGPLAPLYDHRLNAALAAPVALCNTEHQGLALSRPVLHFAESKARDHCFSAAV